MSTSKYYSFYSYAETLSKVAELLMYASAVIFLLNAFCPCVRAWNGWRYVLNTNTVILFIINALLMLVSWLNFAARGNKLAGCIDNAYGTTLAQEPANPNYYDNNNVTDYDLKFALNVYESCFFSDAILRKQTANIVIKNLIIVGVFFVAIIFEFGYLLMSVLGLFVVVHFIRKLFVFLVVKSSLSKICTAYQSVFNAYQQGGQLDMQAVMLNMSNYETAMIWLGTVLSGKIYRKYNAELTQQWLEKQQGFLRENDTK